MELLKRVGFIVAIGGLLIFLDSLTETKTLLYFIIASMIYDLSGFTKKDSK